MAHGNPTDRKFTDGKFQVPTWKTMGNVLKFLRSHSSMDRISDSGSDDLGSNPGGITKQD